MDNSKDFPHREGNGVTYRDYEKVHHATLSLIAGLDLVTREAIPLVRETYKSSDFIEFLKILDSKYPKGVKIRLVLDNHSAHTSKETRAFLATIPGRFEFVFAPKHGSWPNMIEGFFGKKTNQMFRGIRVQSKEELADRIYRYFDKENATLVVHRWKYKMDEIGLDEKVSKSKSLNTSDRNTRGKAEKIFHSTQSELLRQGYLHIEVKQKDTSKC